MTRTMLDGIASDASAMARSGRRIDLVAGYVDGAYAWSPAHWALFPHSVHVRIAVFASTNDGVVLDCEPGNCTPAQSVDWVLMRRRAGVDPTVYCNQLDPQVGWPAVRAAFHARGVAEPHYWVANYSGNTAIPPGAVALQYTDTGSYDLSLVADYWPGVDQGADMPLTNADADLILNRLIPRAGGRMGGDTTLGGMVAWNDQHVGDIEAAVNTAASGVAAKVDALNALVAKLAAPAPAQVDLAALEALIEQHLASGSVPSVIAVAVAKHLGADLSAG